MHHVIEEVRKEAAKLGTEVTGSELVGLVPLDAMLDAGRHYLGKAGKNADEQALVMEAIKNLGLDDLAPFDPELKIIDYLIKKKQEAKQDE